MPEKEIKKIYCKINTRFYYEIILNFIFYIYDYSN